VARVLIRRLPWLIVTVVCVTAATWLTFRLLRPERFRDDPRPVSTALVDYLEGAFLHFDLGRSWAGSRRPVAELLGQGLPADLWLLAGGVVFGLVVGLAGDVMGSGIF